MPLTVRIHTPNIVHPSKGRQKMASLMNLNAFEMTPMEDNIFKSVGGKLQIECIEVISHRFHKYGLHCLIPV